MSIAVPARTVRILVVCALAVIAAVVGALLIPFSAQATTIALSGTVDGPTGAVLKSITVTALDYESSPTPTAVATASTGTTGVFSFPTLEAGQYTLSFSASATTYFQYLGNTTDVTNAQELTLAPGGGNHSYITATLSGGGAIGGTVKTTTGAPLHNYTVEAFSLGDDGTTTHVASVKTSTSGAYSIGGLVPGTYQVEALDPTSATPTYAPQFGGGATEIDLSNTYEVVTGVTQTVNFRLGKSGTISGKVTGIHSSAIENLADVRVTPYYFGTQPPSTTSAPNAARSVLTKSDGTFTVTGLAPGYYTLEFAPRTTAPTSPSGTVYGRTFLGSTDESVDGTAIDIVSGTAAKNANVQLVAAATVHGLVRDSLAPTGPGLPNVRITLDYKGQFPDEFSNDGAATTLTAADGSFSFPGIGPGHYTFTVGSSTDSTPLPGEDTTWQREQLDLGNAITSGENFGDFLTVVKKDPLGLHPTTAPSIDIATSLAVGETLFANNGVWSPSIDSEPLIQWYRNGQPIPQATQTAYQVQPADAGAKISFRITASNFAYGTASAMTAQTADVANSNGLQFLSSSSITGDPHVGKTVAVDPGGWLVGAESVSPLFSYQWQASPDGGTTWNDIVGATGATHPLVANDLTAGPLLRVHIVATLEGYNPVQTDSDPVTILSGVISLVKAPVLTKGASSYSMSVGTWSPTSGSTNVIWHVYNSDGTLLQGYNQATLPKAGLAGKYVNVEVLRTLNGYTTFQTAETVVQQGNAPVPSGALTITATADQVGVEMDAPAPTWTPSIDGLTFQWQRKTGSTWASITHATLNYYIPVAADLNHSIRAVLTTKLTGYPSDVFITAGTPAVSVGAAAVLDPAPSTPMQFVGTVESNSLVTFLGGDWNGNGADKISYQWETSADGGATKQPITGATSQTLIIPPTTVGKQLYILITASSSGYTSANTTYGGQTIAKGSFIMKTAPTVKRSGSNFVVTTGTWSPTPTSYSYHWGISQPDGITPILVITSTPTLPTATVGAQHASVEVIPSSSQATDGNSFPITVQTGTMTPTGSLAMGVSTSSVGSTFFAPTAATWTTVNSPTTIAHQWEYLSGSTWKLISGATGGTFVPTPSYLGKKLRVRIVASSAGYNTATVYSTTQTVLASAVTPTPGAAANAPQLGGNVAIGSVVSVSPGTWSVAGLTFGYQWGWRSGGNFVAISGATKSTYAIAPQYFADTLSVLITAKGAGYPTATTNIDESTIVGDGTLLNTVAPKVTAASSGKLTATAGTWNVAGTTESYLWEVIDPVTGSSIFQQDGPANTYIPSALAGTDYIRLTVTAHKADYNSIARAVTARAGAKLTPSTTLTVTGLGRAGTLASAATVTWSSTNPSILYQWYRGTAKISGAQAANYTLTSADVGKAISVTESVSKTGYTGATYTVHFVTALAAIVPTAVIDPSISGGPVVDGTLTANPGTWNVAGLTFTYQWQREHASILGATGKTYRLTVADEAEDVTVVVTTHRANYLTQQFETTPRTIDAGGALTLSKLTLPATVALGTKLTPTLGIWNFPVSTHYDWQYEAPSASAWVDIDGAESNTYTPTVADALATGGMVRLVIIASRPGHPTTSVTSTATTLH
ncbi:MAG TPA: carboxypeptidase regulatory-like domain-containing protein [Galbitalea sp.]|jgi:hypothetical protein|nr:carboxypeptidase regulatory-like domain-containing protein [Galbitalea sp.]